MSELEIIDCEQNSEEWHRARAGIVTASEFATVMAKGRGKSESVTRRKYMLHLVGERLAGPSPFDSYSNGHMTRGHEYESEAADLYVFQTDNEIQRIGFMRRGDVGYSPDGLIDENGLVEIKTKLYHLHLECLLSDEVPSEHIPQLQGGLWVSGREWIDFVSYSPGLPLFVKRVYRDEEYIKNLAQEVDRFLAEMNEIIEKINRRVA